MAEDKAAGSTAKEALWEGIKEYFTAQRTWQLIGDVKDVKPKTRGMIEELSDYISGIIPACYKDWIDVLRENKAILPEQEGMFDIFKDLPFPMDLIGLVVLSMGYSSSFIANIADITGNPLRQSLNAAYPTQLAPLENLIQSAFIAPEKTKDIREELGRYGFSDKAVDYMLLSKYRLYDVDFIRVLFQRGVLSNDKMYERMRELGFTDTRIAELIQTFDVIPGPADLFHLVGKEAFEPETITKLGLDAEYPEDQTIWLKKQGVSKYWAEKYWAAHWYQPSIQQGMAMRHRDLIDDDTMDLLFRAQELPPFWREKIKGITYLPYARVDIRRLWKSGVIKQEAEVYDNYKWQGYDHEHALKLTQFAILDAEETERSITLGQITGAYEDRLISREDAKALIMSLAYSNEKAEFLLISKDYEIESRLLKDRINLIKERFINRFADKFDTLRDLNLLDLPSAQVTILMEQWEIKLWKDNKMPSKADLAKFYGANLLDEPSYLEEMDKLGYNKYYANMYLALLRTKAENIDSE